MLQNYPNFFLCRLKVNKKYEFREKYYMYIIIKDIKFDLNYSN